MLEPLLPEGTMDLLSLEMLLMVEDGSAGEEEEITVVEVVEEVKGNISLGLVSIAKGEDMHIALHLCKG